MDGDVQQPEQERSSQWSSTQEAVEDLRPWFHNLHLPDGTQTEPDHFLGDYPSYKWDGLSTVLPARLDGWTVLDVGCNAGYYSIELARRGAEVTAVDSNPHYLRQARWAAAQFGIADRIAFERQNLYGLLQDDRTYDLVLFMGVLYHLRYPLLGLDIVARKARRLLALLTLSLPGGEGLTDAEVREAEGPDAEGLGFDNRERMLQPGWPAMAFVEHRFNNDPTTWWVPNQAAIRALTRSTGLRVVARPGRELYVCEPDGHATAADGSDYAAVRSLIRPG